MTAQSNAERKSRVSGSAVRFLLFFLWSSQTLTDSRSSKLVSCPLNKHRLSGRVKTQVQCQVESNTRSGMCVSSPRSLWITCYPMGKPWVRLAEPQLRCLYGAYHPGSRENHRPSAKSTQRDIMLSARISLRMQFQQLVPRQQTVVRSSSVVCPLCDLLAALHGWFWCTKAITSPTRQK